MKVEHESGFWAEVKDRITFADWLAMTAAMRESEESGKVVLLLRAVSEWSAGEVTEAVLGELEWHTATWLFEIAMEAWNDPKAAGSNSSQQLATVA